MWTYFQTNELHMFQMCHTPWERLSEKLKKTPLSIWKWISFLLDFYSQELDGRWLVIIENGQLLSTSDNHENFASFEYPARPTIVNCNTMLIEWCWGISFLDKISEQIVNSNAFLTPSASKYAHFAFTWAWTAASPIFAKAARFRPFGWFIPATDQSV